jgi:hypothetical protein
VFRVRTACVLTYETVELVGHGGGEDGAVGVLRERGGEVLVPLGVVDFDES